MSRVWHVKGNVKERVNEDRGETWHSGKFWYKWIKECIDICYTMSTSQDGTERVKEAEEDGQLNQQRQTTAHQGIHAVLFVEGLRGLHLSFLIFGVFLLDF